jgi:hypothetical protein
VWHTLYSSEPRRKGYKFKVGDQVRISISKNIFDKGYKDNWTEEIFTISKRIPRNPVVYRLKEHDGVELSGTFYEQELQRVNYKEEGSYKIEKILRRKKTGSKMMYFVKWLGYPDKYNSWVSGDDFE